VFPHATENIGPEWVVDVDVSVGDGDDHPVVVAGVANNVGHLKLNRDHKLTSAGLICLRVWCVGKKNLIHQDIITEDQYS
jgi:hypothetical protein